MTQMRFKKWCQKLGAHLQGVYSLDERLRDAVGVKKYILDCLDQILTALGEVQEDMCNPEGNGSQQKALHSLKLTELTPPSCGRSTLPQTAMQEMRCRVY